MGTKSYIGNGTALSAMLHEACVRKCDAPMSVRIRLWPLSREDSPRVLIGAAGTWRSDWRRWDLGVVIGQSGFRFLALAREAIDSTRAFASGSLHSAAICRYKVRQAHNMCANGLLGVKNTQSRRSTCSTPRSRRGVAIGQKFF